MASPPLGRCSTYPARWALIGLYQGMYNAKSCSDLGACLEFGQWTQKNGLSTGCWLGLSMQAFTRTHAPDDVLSWECCVHLEVKSLQTSACYASFIWSLSTHTLRGVKYTSCSKCIYCKMLFHYQHEIHTMVQLSTSKATLNYSMNTVNTSLSLILISFVDLSVFTTCTTRLC